MADKAPLASRSGTSNPFGKCTEKVQTLLPEEIKEGLRRKAFDMGVSEQEYLRELITVDVLGVDMLLNLHQERLSKFNTRGVSIGDKFSQPLNCKFHVVEGEEK